MPLPTDEKLLSLGRDLLQQFDTIFGLHEGFRPAHAKGLLLNGTFRPSREASLTKAPHANRASTPVLVRFSNSTGLPVLPDGDPNANPRGMAIRFVLGEHVHTDIIAHSTDGFPTRTGQEFLEFLRAAAKASTSKTELEAFLGSHPAALRFVQTPKPTPASFAREQYFGVTAMKFIAANGKSRYGRYRMTPDAGVAHLEDAAVAGREPDFLFDELKDRVAKGPVGFRILVQAAEEGDAVDDATIHWPKERPLIDFGQLQLTEVEAQSAEEQQQIIFDPIPRVDGIEPSADPLLELRAAIYLMSGRRRRQAKVQTSSAG